MSTNAMIQTDVIKRSDVFDAFLDKVRDAYRCYGHIDFDSAFTVSLTVRSLWHELWDCDNVEYEILNSYVTVLLSSTFVGPVQP